MPDSADRQPDARVAGLDQGSFKSSGQQRVSRKVSRKQANSETGNHAYDQFRPVSINGSICVTTGQGGIPIMTYSRPTRPHTFGTPYLPLKTGSRLSLNALTASLWSSVVYIEAMCEAAISR